MSAPATNKRCKPADSATRMADMAVDAFHSNYPSFSIDTLLTWPRKARSVAAQVASRMNVNCTEEFEHQVLRSLLNSRKHGDLRRDRA